MIHEFVELIKALAWPCVVLYVVAKFQTEIRSLLHEMPRVFRRMRSAHGLGVEIELDKIDEELPLAERQVLSLSPRTEPAPDKEERDDANADPGISPRA